MSFNWQAGDILRMPENSTFEHSATEKDGGECFSLFVEGNICAVIRFGQRQPWLASFIDYLSKDAFPSLTLQDWMTILGIQPATFLGTLNVLLRSGFVRQPEREIVQSRCVQGEQRQAWREEQIAEQMSWASDFRESASRVTASSSAFDCADHEEFGLQATPS